MILHRLTIPRAIAAAIPEERFAALAELMRQVTDAGLDWRPARSSFVGMITSDLVNKALTHLLAAEGYTFAFTRAPRALDFDNTYELLLSRRLGRLIAVRTTLAAFQLDRYEVPC